MRLLLLLLVTTKLSDLYLVRCRNQGPCSVAMFTHRQPCLGYVVLIFGIDFLLFPLPKNERNGTFYDSKGQFSEHGITWVLLLLIIIIIITIIIETEIKRSIG